MINLACPFRLGDAVSNMSSGCKSRTIFAANPLGYYRNQVLVDECYTMAKLDDVNVFLDDCDS